MNKDTSQLDRFTDRFCLDLIAKAVSLFVENNYDKLECRYSQVEPQGARLDDLRIEFTTNIKTYGNIVGFDAIVGTDIEIYETRRGTDDSDLITQRFKVPCQVIFEEKVEHFRINDGKGGGIEIYTTSIKNDSPLAATNSLVPVIYGENYDLEATRFLKKYYPEALKAPMPVPLEKIAEAMGLPLIIYDKHLSTDFSVFGKICFADEEITVYDELGVPEIVTAKRGQIFIDPDIYNVGCLRNTVAHELFHWVRHRLYVTIMRIFETTDFKSTRCRVRSISERKRDGELSDEEWMELHANSISPRIIMPVETVKSKMLEILRKHKYNPILNDSERSLRAAIIELAEFYEVSKQLATIRLSQLGIEQAQDILDADNERNILYASQIPHTDILREYAENESFRSAVESGLFRYVEGRFIINDTKYISKKQGGIYLLTDYAREHLDECALRFSAVLPDTEKRYGGELNRKNRQSYAAVKKYAEDALRLQTAEARAKANEAFRDEAAYHKKLITAVGSGTCFAECFNALMKVVFDTINVPEHKQGAKFFDITGIATKIYYDMRSAKPDYCPKDRTLVAICAGFDLDISVAEKLFAAGGKALRHTDEHLAFRIILTVCRGWGITERNDYLEVLGFGRLTDDI